MADIIRSIEIIEEDFKGNTFLNMDGYAITTDSQVIKLMISNYQQCCEDWGYFISEDNLEQFIGAEIKEITLTDVCRNTAKLDERNLRLGSEYDKIMFVNIETDRGTLQFTAYNSHNGYYGHNCKVISKQLTTETYL